MSDLITFNITRDRLRVLKRAVYLRLGEMRMELARTDNRLYHLELKNDLEALESIFHDLNEGSKEESSSDEDIPMTGT